jgi:hypothetical protein
MRVEVSTSVNVWIVVFWVVTLPSGIKYSAGEGGDKIKPKFYISVNTVYCYRYV